MATNDFLPFCGTTTGSNLLTQSEYVSDPQRPIGNQPGVARSKLVNKATRQAAWIASQVAQFLSDRTGDDVLDNQVSLDVQNTMKAAWPAYTALSFYQGYHDVAATWSTTSGTFADFTPTGTATLTQRQASGITVTTAASDLPGIVFTPASATAVYMISVNTMFQLSSPVGNNASGALRLFDGTTEISYCGQFYKDSHVAALLNSTPGTGIYIPGTTSPVTVKVQGFCGGDPGFSLGLGYIGPAIEWTLVRIK